jgi:hypothetical protein
MRRTMFAAILVVAAGLLTSCYEIHDQKIIFGPDFGPKDEKDQAIDRFAFVVGQTIEWCNTSSFSVVILIDDPSALGGRRTLLLAPGECVTIRVLRGRGDFMITWAYRAEDGTVEGRGGTPGKVDCPPAPQPC